MSMSEYVARWSVLAAASGNKSTRQGSTPWEVSSPMKCACTQLGERGGQQGIELEYSREAGGEKEVSAKCLTLTLALI